MCNFIAKPQTLRIRNANGCPVGIQSFCVWAKRFCPPLSLRRSPFHKVLSSLAFRFNLSFSVSFYTESQCSCSDTKSFSREKGERLGERTCPELGLSQSRVCSRFTSFLWLWQHISAFELRLAFSLDCSVDWANSRLT
ncbi:GD21882 [Drosophila simulans]|uniref:GD21882 n=1 Tax=Drosophila simulans TaxID=7240 RepID=B4Q7V8_DROSI|nr:GD21882 [Drosophila simulans]